MSQIEMSGRARRAGLSKSRLTSLEQCERKLWLVVNRPDAGVRDLGVEQRFATGHVIGSIACSLHPNGVMVDAEPDLAAALATTKALLDGGVRAPIFEATFEHDGVLVRVDVLAPHPDGGWSIAEVKSSTSVKDYHLGDLATQVWVLRHSGVEVRSAAIRYINNQFVLVRIDDYEGLFSDSEQLDALEELVGARPALVAKAREVLAGDEPRIGTGDHCTAPFDCEFARHCAAGESPAPEWPITLLPRTGKKVAKTWAEKGVFDLRNIPAGALTGDSHQRIHEATLTGTAFHDYASIAAVVSVWAWPRAYLDFETIGLAAPRWLGSKPYQNVPFQFSCHIEFEDGRVTHDGFLSIDGADPRRDCAEALVELLGDEKIGAVIAYNASFERGCLKNLADQFADLAAELTVIGEKIVDLLPVARSFYYHPDQRGSWSIKSVLRAISPDLSYEKLEIGDGMQAQVAWLEAISADTPHDRRQAIRHALETYCQRDTEAMIFMVRHLSQAPT